MSTDSAAALRPKVPTCQNVGKEAIIFGGAGFVGSHLVSFLLSRRDFQRIVVADIAPPDTVIPGVVYETIDVTQPIPVGLAHNANNAMIFNLAAVHRTPGHMTHEYYQANVTGAINVTNFAENAGINHIIFTSSIAVYGPDEVPKHEDSVPSPASAYGWSKLLAEDVHRAWLGRQPDRHLTITRPAVIFGPGENGNFTRLAHALKRGFFVFPGRRDTIKACGYVGELVRTMLFVHETGGSYNLYNFCYPTPYTIEEICEAFQRVGGFPAARGTVPLAAMRVAALGFEFLNALGLRNSVSRERVKKLVASTWIEPGYLKQVGYEYETDLEEGLRQWAASGALPVNRVSPTAVMESRAGTREGAQAREGRGGGRREAAAG